MADFNQVNLIGRLTRDPEVRCTQSGTYVCSFGLAIGRKYTQNGIRQEETTFVDITAWKDLANNCGQYLRKGDPVFINGRLKLDTWDDKVSGQKRSKLSVVAINVQFLKGRDAGEHTQYEQPQQQQQQQQQWTPPSANDLGEPPF